MMPMPSGPQSVPSEQASQSPQANPQSLLGQSAPSSLSPSPEQQNEAFMMEIQDLTVRITSLARQYPAGAENFEVAIQSLIEAMTKSIIASSTTEPTAAPNLVG